MPVSYTVEVEGLDELIERLKRYPQIVRSVVVPVMKETVIKVQDNIVQEMHKPVSRDGRPPSVPIYRGRLETSTSVEAAERVGLIRAFFKLFLEASHAVLYNVEILRMTARAVRGGLNDGECTGC